MLAMGRDLNVSFMLGFQEVSGIYARLGEKTASLLGNANLTIAMRQRDSGRTREWIEKTAGQTQVTQATSFHGGVDGAYREARSAEVRTVSRVACFSCAGRLFARGLERRQMGSDARAFRRR